MLPHAAINLTPEKKNQNKSLSDSKTLSDVKKTRRQLNYMFKVDNRNSRTKVWNMFKVNYKDTMASFLCLLF